MARRDGAKDINQRQRALLHVARRQLGLDEENYRSILRQAAGVESSRDLDPAGFDRVMEVLARMGFSPRRRYPSGRARGAPDPDALVTPAQQKRMADLYTELGWTILERQRGFNRRVVHKPWPQTRGEANKIIEALKAMIARRKEA